MKYRRLYTGARTYDILLSLSSLLCDRDRSRCRALGGARSGSPQLLCTMALLWFRDDQMRSLQCWRPPPPPPPQKYVRRMCGDLPLRGRSEWSRECRYIIIAILTILTSQAPDTVDFYTKIMISSPVSSVTAMCVAMLAKA